MSSTVFDSKLVKTNSRGEMICIICSGVLKSPKFWIAHINGRQHRSAVSGSKVRVAVPLSEPDPPRPSVDPAKRKHPDSATVSTEDCKRPKQLRSFDSESLPNVSNVNGTLKTKNELGESLSYTADQTHSLSTTKNMPGVSASSESSQKADLPDKRGLDGVLPEGFFDDRKADAKIRKVDNKDPLDDEYAKFQKALQEEEQLSQVMVEEEDVERQLEREIEEIDAQIDEWSRVNQLQERKDQIAAKMAETSVAGNSEINMTEVSDEEDLSFDTLADWRVKRI